METVHELPNPAEIRSKAVEYQHYGEFKYWLRRDHDTGVKKMSCTQIAEHLLYFIEQYTNPAEEDFKYYSELSGMLERYEGYLTE